MDFVNELAGLSDVIGDLKGQVDTLKQHCLAYVPFPAYPLVDLKDVQDLQRKGSEAKKLLKGKLEEGVRLGLHQTGVQITSRDQQIVVSEYVADLCKQWKVSY